MRFIPIIYSLIQSNRRNRKKKQVEHKYGYKKAADILKNIPAAM